MDVAWRSSIWEDARALIILEEIEKKMIRVFENIESKKRPA